MGLLIGNQGVKAVAGGCQALARELSQLKQRGLLGQNAFHPYGGYQAPFVAMQVRTVEVNPRGDIDLGEVRSQLKQLESQAGLGTLFPDDQLAAAQSNFTHQDGARDLSLVGSVLAGLPAPRSMILWGLYEDAFFHPWSSSRMRANPTGTADQAKAEEKHWLTFALRHFSRGETVIAADEDLAVVTELSLSQLRVQRVETVMPAAAGISFRFDPPGSPWHARVSLPVKVGIFTVV